MNGISDLLKRYGTSLAETRALMPKLTEAVKRQRAIKPPAFPTMPEFFTPEEARQFGVELEAGWMLKVTPGGDGVAPSISYITPERWEILEDQGLISPEGKRYTREEYEAERVAVEREWALTEAQMADPGYWRRLREWEEVERVFGRVFPEEDIEELLAGMAVSPTMPPPERRRAEQAQEAFLQSVWEIGRTEDTEELLRRMFPGITEEAIVGLFAPMAVPPVPEIARPSPKAVQSLTKAVFPEYEANVDELIRWGAQNPEAFIQKIKDAGPSKYSEALLSIVSPSPLKELAFFERAWHSLVYGTGEAYKTFGGVLKWLEGKGITMPAGEITQPQLLSYKTWYITPPAPQGKTQPQLMTEFGESIQENVIPPMYSKDVTWRSFSDPEFYATTVCSAAPLTLGLIAAGVVAFFCGAKIAAAAGLGAFTKLVLASLLGTAVSRPMEGAFEAGGVYDEMIARGKTEEEAEAGADEVFRENLNLAGIDAVQLATMFFPLTRLGSSLPVVQRILNRRILVSGLKAPVVGIMEAGEEGWQEAITATALGDEVPGLFPLLTQDRAVGFIFGFGMGSAGSVIDVLTARIKNDFTPELLAEFNKNKIDGLKAGLTEDQAELQAFDRIAETPEGRRSIEGTIQDLKNWARAAEPVVPTDPPVLMTIPPSVKILDTIMVGNWMRTLLQKVAKVPPARTLIEWGLGTRILVNRQAEAIEDIVGRGRFLHTEISRRAEGSEALIYWRLFEIESNPIKLFGFNKQAVSTTIKRLTEEADGTLEDIFTHPEQYALNEKQMQYITRAHHINTQILNMLREEGVAPENVGDAWWMHRVVQGKYDPNGELTKVRGRPGVKRGRIGAKVSFEMHRKAPTMADGIAWGILYGRDPAEAVSTYASEAFKKIADARFEKYIAEQLEPLAQMGVLPKEELLRKYPEVVERAIITAEELADTKSFVDKINRAIRGEKLPEGTLRAIERRFPDLGRKFRALSQAPAIAEKQLRQLLAQQDRTIKNLTKRIEKVKQVDIKALKGEITAKVRADIEAEARLAIPDEQKLIEAFRLMDYEDRLAFRSTMDGQIDEIGQVLYEQESELAAINEFLKTDLVAQYHGVVRGKRVPLTAVLKKGQFPETFSIPEAQMLMMGHYPKTIIKGRVPRSVVVDELADHFNMTEQELIDRIEFIRVQRETAGDLRYLVNYANNRHTQIKRMLEILDRVDTEPEFIPVTEPGLPPEPVAPLEVTAPEVIKAKVEYKPPGAMKMKITPEQAFERLDFLTRDLDLTKTRLARLKATKKKKPGWEAYDRFAEEVVGIDVRIEEQEAVLSNLQDEFTALEDGIEKAGAVRPAPLIPPVVEAIPFGYKINKVAGVYDIYRPDGEMIGTRPTEAAAIKYVQGYEAEFKLAVPEGVPREAMVIDEFKETLGKVIAETRDEIKATKTWLTGQRKQKQAKIPIDERTFAEEQARVASLEDRLPTLSEMVAKPEEYFGRLESEFPNIYELLLDRGRALKIIPRRPPVMPEAVPEVPLKEELRRRGEELARLKEELSTVVDEARKMELTARIAELGKAHAQMLERAASELREFLLTYTSEKEWGLMSFEGKPALEDRAVVLGRVGLPVNLASKDWADLTETEQKRLTGEIPIVEAKPRAVEVPKAEPGMPEAGIQKDIFGYEIPVFPKGKGIVTQISMEDYGRLVELHKKEGLPPPNVVIKPKIEGIEGLEAEAQIAQITYEVPGVKSAKERRAALETLRGEVKALAEARRLPFWEARSERAYRMDEIRQPGIEEGYIMHPFAGGRMFDQEFIDSFNKFFGHDAGLKVLRPTADTAGILRILKAALDWSQPAIQGTLSWGLAHSYLLSDPKKGGKLMGGWYKCFFEQIGAFFNPGIAARFMEANHPAISRRIAAGGSARAVFFFQEMQAVVGKGKIARMAETALRHIPLTPYQRAEVSFFAGGEIVRDRFWQIFEEEARAKGEEGQLARFLDILTGIADPRAMGVPLTIRQMEQSWIWFSSAYTRSYLTAVGEIFRGGMTGAMARRAVAGFIVAGAAYFTGIQYAISTLTGKDDDEAWEDVQRGFGLHQDPITGDWEWRPTAAMMSLKIGDNYFGIGGGIYGLMRLAGNIWATVQEVGERERIDLIRIMKHGSLNKRDNPFIYWWYCRSSALFSPIYEMITKQDFLGYPIETPEQYIRYIISVFEPIWVEQSINPLIPGMAGDREVPENALETVAWIAGELLGLRVNPEYAWQRFYNKANEYIPNIPEDQLDAKQREAIAQGRKLDWRSLTKIQKINLLFRYPDLRAVYEEAQADSELRAQPHWKQWEGRQDEERTTYYDRGNSLVERVISGELDTRELREMWGDAGQNYGVAIDSIEKESAYQEIYDFFDRQREKGDKYLFEADMALAEYIDIMFTEYVDEKGDIDWDAKDRAIDAYIEKWGEDYYEIIRQMYAQKRLLADLSPVLVRLSDDKDKLGRGYWRLPYKPIIEMDEDDEAERNIPAEYFALWKQYQALETDEEREVFIQRHPEMAKDWRAEYRKANPEADAMLALWGYGGKLQSMEAYDLVTQWGRELGIPLDQMGLGLPPHSLINQYFDYASIISQFSGNSAEAKLFRLEHPEFTAWAVENWGWVGTEGYKDIEYYRLQMEWDEKWSDIDSKYRSLPTSGYEQEWFLMEHPDYLEAAIQYYGWQEKDFSKVPSREVYALLQEYDEVKEGKSRLVFRHENPQLEKWLVDVKGYTPVGDRWEDGVEEGEEIKEKETISEVETLYKTYLGLPAGTPRLDFRARHPEFDKWLVKTKGYKPIGDRGSETAPKTPWEIQQEAERFKELF